MGKTSSILRDGILGLLKAVMAIIAYALGMVLMQSLASRLAVSDTTLQMLLTAASTLIGGTGSAWLMCILFDRKPIRVLGYGRNGGEINGGRNLLQGFILGAVLILIGLGILVVAGAVKITGHSYSYKILWPSLVLFFCVAIAEESCFRGYVTRNIADAMGNIWGLLVSGILFSIPHLLNPNTSVMSFLGILAAGIFLGAAYVFTRNLWLAIGIHFGWNFMQSMVGFNVSGMDMPGVLALEFSGTDFWSGGEFGFEASGVCLILLVSATALLVMHYRHENGKNPI